MPVRRAGFLPALFLVSVGCLSAQAADEGAVTGVVIEANGTRVLGFVNGALVTAISDGDLKKRVSDPSSELHQRLTRPPKGIFTIPALRNDQWCFLAYKDGFDSYRSKNLIRIKAKDTVDAGQLPIRKTVVSSVPSASALRHTRVEVTLVMYHRPPAPPPSAGDYQVRVHVKDVLERDVSIAFVSALQYSAQQKLVDIVHGFTDKAGNFESGVLPAGDRSSQYILTVSEYGYESSVTVKGWVPSTVSQIELGRPLDVSESEGIVTTEASRRKVFTGESGRTIEALPLAGMRSFDLLALLAPGIVEAPETLDRVGPSFAPGIGTAGSFVSNGLRPRENSFTVDDGDDNEALSRNL